MNVICNTLLVLFTLFVVGLAVCVLGPLGIFIGGVLVTVVVLLFGNSFSGPRKITREEFERRRRALGLADRRK